LFEFSIPTGSPQSPRPLATSVAAHILVLALLFTFRFSGVVSSSSVHPHITVIAPLSETHWEPKRLQVPRPREFRPAVPARLETPGTPLISAPAYEAPKTVVPEIPQAAPEIAPAIPVSGFIEVLPPVVQAKLPVKTGGFNVESSVSGPARRTLSTVGSFDSANAIGREVAHASTATLPGGFSDASASSQSEVQRGPVRSGAFGDTTIDRNVAAPRKSSSPAQSTAVEIVSKPKPAYTSEARLKKIEGEVLLEMQFSASGEARVLRLVRGLGYGLDENAVAAALGIRFHPATRDGAAVDAAALVHIVFQLAN